MDSTKSWRCFCLVFFFEQSNNLVKIETVFFQFRATNEKYTVQHEKTMQFCSIEIYTHIPKKTTNIYIHKHTEKCYTMIYTPNLPKHKTKLSHMQKSMGTSTQRKSICSISTITACSNVTTKIIEIPSGY